MLTEKIQNRLKQIAARNQRFTVLTGAGISAESGIPTFRGPEGYWTIGSRVYHPQQMATYHMFTQKPDEVWKWYLYRRGVCRRARPNAGHLALAAIERALANRFGLITQNVDGLHLRAGNSRQRTFQIHGNVFFMRCSQGCTTDIYPVPEELPDKSEDQPLTENDRRQLVCPRCGARSRPHVLWFDETYNEEHFKFESALAIAHQTDLLLIVGTSGATTLPNHVAGIVAQRRVTIIDINIEPNPFSQLAVQTPHGAFVQSASAEVLPAIADLIGLPHA